jgi:hypothetical protein
MNVINLNRETAELELSINELTILANSLKEAYKQLRTVDFEERIRGITKEETFQISNVIGKSINLLVLGSTSVSETHLISSIKLIGNKVRFQFTYKSILGIGSILNELYYGMFRVQDFRSSIGFDKSNVSSLLDSIHFDVVEKMQEGSPEDLICRKATEISNNLNLRTSSLESKSSSPELKTECILKFNSHILVFFLASLTNRKIFSGIHIAIGKMANSHQAELLAKSNAQEIRHSDLVRLVAYLGLALKSAISNVDLERISLLLFDSKRNPLFDIKILSKCIELDGLKIRFRLCLDVKENDTDRRYFDIEDTATRSDINSFVSSIQEFLSKLPRKEMSTDS